jgi:hypothetical protein
LERFAESDVIRLVTEGAVKGLGEKIAGAGEDEHF